jgi:hypothetical protein
MVFNLMSQIKSLEEINMQVPNLFTHIGRFLILNIIQKQRIMYSRTSLVMGKKTVKYSPCVTNITSLHINNTFLYEITTIKRSHEIKKINSWSFEK